MHRNNAGGDRQDPAPGRPRDQRADEALLDAALALFAEGGLASTTFDGVAKRAGVSRSTLYRRWSTRDDLLVAALQRARRNAEAHVEDWASRPLDEILSIFTGLAASALTDARSVDLLRQIAGLPADSPVRAAYWSTIVEPRRTTFTALIHAARLRGELPQGADPELLQDQLAGALAYRTLLHPTPLPHAEAERYVADLLVGLGLTPVGNPAPPP